MVNQYVLMVKLEQNFILFKVEQYKFIQKKKRRNLLNIYIMEIILEKVVFLIKIKEEQMQLLKQIVN